MIKKLRNNTDFNKHKTKYNTKNKTQNNLKHKEIRDIKSKLILIDF